MHVIGIKRDTYFPYIAECFQVLGSWQSSCRDLMPGFTVVGNVIYNNAPNSLTGSIGSPIFMWKEISQLKHAGYVIRTPSYSNYKATAAGFSLSSPGGCGGQLLIEACAYWSLKDGQMFHRERPGSPSGTNPAASSVEFNSNPLPGNSPYLVSNRQSTWGSVFTVKGFIGGTVGNDIGNVQYGIKVFRCPVASCTTSSWKLVLDVTLSKSGAQSVNIKQDFAKLIPQQDPNYYYSIALFTYAYGFSSCPNCLEVNFGELGVDTTKYIKYSKVYVIG
jgi:hypothetical protein